MTTGRLACRLCGAPDAITLSDDSAAVTCGACGRTHPRRLYDDPSAPKAPTPSWAVPIVVALALGAIGAGGAIAIGGVLRTVFTAAMAAMLVGMAMVFGAFGVRGIQAPTSLRLARSEGMDAWGKQQFGASETPTAARGRTVGVVNVIAAIAFLLIAIVFGRVLP